MTGKIYTVEIENLVSSKYFELEGKIYALAGLPTYSIYGTNDRFVLLEGGLMLPCKTIVKPLYPRGRYSNERPCELDGNFSYYLLKPKFKKNKVQNCQYFEYNSKVYRFDVTIENVVTGEKLGRCTNHTDTQPWYQRCIFPLDQEVIQLTYDTNENQVPGFELYYIEE